MTVYQLKFVNRTRISKDLLLRLKEAKAANNALSAAISMYLAHFRLSVLGYPPTKNVASHEVDLTDLGFQKIVFKFKVENGVATIVDIHRSPEEGPDGPGGDGCPQGSIAFWDSECGLAECFSETRSDYSFSNSEQRVAAIAKAKLKYLPLNSVRQSVTYAELLEAIVGVINPETARCDVYGLGRNLRFERDWLFLVLVRLVCGAVMPRERACRIGISKYSDQEYARAIAALAKTFAYHVPDRNAVDLLSSAERLFRDQYGPDGIALERTERLFSATRGYVEADGWMPADCAPLVRLTNVIFVAYTLEGARVLGGLSSGLAGPCRLREEHDLDAADARTHSATGTDGKSSSLAQVRLRLLDVLLMSAAVEVTGPDLKPSALVVVRKNLAKVALLLSEPLEAQAFNKSDTLEYGFLHSRAESVAKNLSLTLLHNLMELGALEIFTELGSDAEKLEATLASLMHHEKQ